MAEQTPIPVEALRGRTLVGLSQFGDLNYPGQHIDAHVRNRRVAIISHAGASMDANATRAEGALLAHGASEIVKVHEKPASELRPVLDNVDSVYITGGNTFALVANMKALRNSDGTLVDNRPTAATEPMDDYLKEAAAKGLVLMGHSAGLMIMGRDIRTCLDPRNLVDDKGNIATGGLDLLPFSFHPHFNDKGVDEAPLLLEYSKADPRAKVFGVENDSFITVYDGNVEFHGVNGAIFEGETVTPVTNGINLNHQVSA